jgi:signal transduction histidine kinase
VVRWLSGLVVGGAVVAVVTGGVALLDPHLPLLSLLVLYLLAILPVALRWGPGPAAVVTVFGTALFAYLFVRPRGTLAVADSGDAVALAVFVVTAIVVTNLAARLQGSAREAARLSEEQAALRRVATLVAQGRPTAVFEAVLREVGELCKADLARMERYDEDGSVTGVAGWSRVPDQLAVGTRFDLDGVSIARQVRQTDGPVRVDTFTAATGAIADEARRLGIRCSIGCPIVVNGQLWGVIAASSKDQTAFPSGTETQISRFTELVATAIANAEDRAEITRLLAEQAALRRVATLVASEAPPVEVFRTVAEEIGQLLDADLTLMFHNERDGMGMIVAQVGPRPEGVVPGSRWTLDPQLALAEAARTGKPARRDGYDDLTGEFAEAIQRIGIRSSVAIPVVVGGEIWGALSVSTRRDRFPADTDRRMADFTDLVATAITNADARARLRRMAVDQAALRRVATLAARGAEPERVFAAATEEVGVLIGADLTGILRYEVDGSVTYVGGRGGRESGTPDTGTRWQPESGTVVAAVRKIGRPVRHDDVAGEEGAEPGTDVPWGGTRSVVACPIDVAGRHWGTIVVASYTEPLHADTEQRMVEFTEIIAIAIANTENRAELAASRARVIAAGDATRRRLERDLHDGAQQRLVSLALELRHAQGSIPAEMSVVRADIGRAAQELTDALDELRELSRGIHPAVLSEGGLGPALRTLARRSAFPVEVDIHTEDRFPEPIEVAAYYAVSEAITNTTKHAEAAHAQVTVEKHDNELVLSVRDDGAGGADPLRGSGLTGLRDRVEALGGAIRINSPTGEGTSIDVTLPLPASG